SIEPQNARSSIDPSGQDITSYFDGSAFSWPSNWLLNVPTNIYAVRIEVTRGATPDLAGNYDYVLNTWIKQCAANDITCPAYNDTSTFANTKINYSSVTPGDTATLSRTFSLSPIYHQDFDTFYFGWTTATGGATQNVTITRFGLNFIQ
ncbi:MAG TPA: hypothetical protein VEF33_02925, partial [Syntrophales bacterium]|nr:hypothetical protein [Syntrophales bacterium]